MAARGVAKRYAQAVFDLANESGNHDVWLADLTTLANTAEDPLTGDFFQAPQVTETQKRQAIERLLPGEEKRLVRNLAFILIERHRFEILPDVLEVFRDMVLEARGIAIANVTTATEMSSAQQEVVRQQLSAMIGKQVELRPRVDPNLIGGIVARIGDQLIDGSVLTQLRRLRATLAH